MAIKEIENKVYKTEQLNWRDLKFFQNDNLKDLSKENLIKLKNSIIGNSFIDTFQVWEDGKDIYVIDGHHRVKALHLLSEENYIIPEKFTCNFVKFKNRQEAAKAVLIYSSGYAKIEQEGLYEFLELEELCVEELKQEVVIPEIDFAVFEEELNFNGDDEKKEKELDENIKIDNECPSCGYKW